MYQIDINLLNDRPEHSSATAPRGGTMVGGGGDSKMPLVWGGAVAAGLAGLVLVSLAGLSLFNQQLASRNQELDTKLSQLAPELSKIDELQAKEKTILAETAALAKVFNQIKPWSATLQDFRDRVPPTLQITKIEQVAAPAATPGATPSPAPSPAASGGQANGTAPAAPPPNNDLKISGFTLAFSDINDFTLNLRKSPFLKSDQTRLMTSERQPPDQKANNVTQIKYEMQTQLSDVPASELLQVLNSKGASGLVSRIEVLKRQGVMKP